MSRPRRRAPRSPLPSPSSTETRPPPTRASRPTSPASATRTRTVRADRHHAARHRLGRQQLRRADQAADTGVRAGITELLVLHGSSSISRPPGHSRSADANFQRSHRTIRARNHGRQHALRHARVGLFRRPHVTGRGPPAGPRRHPPSELECGGGSPRFEAHVGAGVSFRPTLIRSSAPACKVP